MEVAISTVVLCLGDRMRRGLEVEERSCVVAPVEAEAETAAETGSVTGRAANTTCLGSCESTPVRGTSY
jgi:hypothetical protein